MYTQQDILILSHKKYKFQEYFTKKTTLGVNLNDLYNIDEV